MKYFSDSRRVGDFCLIDGVILAIAVIRDNSSGVPLG